MNNIIANIQIRKDDSFFTQNFFEINYLEIDNMAKKPYIKFKIESLFQKNFKYNKISYEDVIYDDDEIMKEENSKNIKNRDKMSQSLKDLNRSYDSLCLPTENIVNKNNFLKNLGNQQKKDCMKMTEIKQMKEKFNLRMVFLNINKKTMNFFSILIHKNNLLPILTQSLFII